MDTLEYSEIFFVASETGETIGSINPLNSVPQGGEEITLLNDMIDDDSVCYVSGIISKRNFEYSLDVNTEIERYKHIESVVLNLDIHNIKLEQGITENQKEGLKGTFGSWNINTNIISE